MSYSFLSERSLSGLLSDGISGSPSTDLVGRVTKRRVLGSEVLRDLCYPGSRYPSLFLCALEREGSVPPDLSTRPERPGDDPEGGGWESLSPLLTQHTCSVPIPSPSSYPKTDLRRRLSIHWIPCSVEKDRNQRGRQGPRPPGLTEVSGESESGGYKNV